MEHNILASCHSQEVSVAITASTSLSAGPSSPTLTPASSRIFSSAARMRGDIGAYHMSELSHLVRTLRCLSDLGGLLKINQRHILKYSATLASVFTSSARRAVCIIRGILALYSETTADTISEGLKSKIFLGAFPYTTLVRALCAHLFVAGNQPYEFLLIIIIYAPVYLTRNMNASWNGPTAS